MVITADEQRHDWQGVDLATDAVVITAPDGSIVAHADIMNQGNIVVKVYGGVHPEHRQRGLGTYLIRWGQEWARRGMDRAPADARIVVHHYANARNTQERDLLEAQGYIIERTVYVMDIRLESAPPNPARLDGIRIRPFVTGQDERATWETVEDAFRDLWGRVPRPFEEWLEIHQDVREHPNLWYVAEDTASGQLVGVCLARLVPENGGWVDTVGVRRPWRRQGVALALLQTAFGEYIRRGVHSAQLSVDAASPTDAPQLYTRAGMHVAQQILLYSKELRPGKDYTAFAQATTEE